MKSLLLGIFSLWYHPSHVSVTDINLNANSGTYEISMQLFAEDLENVIRKFADSDYVLHEKVFEAETGEVLIDYIQKNFILNLGDEKVDITYIGFEIIDDLVKCYFESEKVNTRLQLSVTNKLFFDLQEEQVNFNHLNIDGQLHSAKTTVEVPVVNFIISRL